MPLFERSTLRSIPLMCMNDVFMTYGLWAVRVPQGEYLRASTQGQDISVLSK